jgi:predicted trehalose synthase
VPNAEDEARAATVASTATPWFEPFVGPYLARQDWVQLTLGLYGAATVPAEVVDVEVLRPGRPGLASVLVAAAGRLLHLVLGWRDLASAPGMLAGRPGAVLGPAEDADGEVLVYDALADAELVLELLAVATGDREHAGHVRPVRSLVSHSSLIFDERLFMKCYRVIEPGSRPEVETVMRLAEVGFAHLAAPVGHWQRDGRDLALVREFVPGAIEGKALAETSLRDLLARAEVGPGGLAFEDVGLAGGDLGPEMRRLGAVSAEMHVALAAAFGRGENGGIRLHGDYHLRRVMRTNRGWIVTGFGDDPLLGTPPGASSTGEAIVASPLEDLADLCWSLRNVAGEAVALCTPATRPHARQLAEGWERRNVGELLRGYLATEGIAGLVVTDPDEVAATLETLVSARADSDR